jgi:Golgi apparatus protein 1
MGPVNNPKALMNAKLSPQCAILADIAEPPNMKQAFDTSLSIALLKSQLDVIDSATGIPLVTRDRRGVAQVSRCRVQRS